MLEDLHHDTIRTLLAMMPLDTIDRGITKEVDRMTTLPSDMIETVSMIAHYHLATTVTMIAEWMTVECH